MICPNCDTHNRENARYCLRCGWWLLPHCPSCHEEIPAGVFFCDQCGLRLAGQTNTTDPHTHVSDQPEPQPILADRPESPGQGLQQYIPKELMSKLEAARASDAMAGERRIVTMLFCDIKGSTTAAEQLDPEEWTEIINGAFEHMIKPVYHYEGTVARLMGDAILAFFGAPIAHEDDPQRAVLAGLDIVAGIRPYGQEIQRRWGLDLNVRVGINTGMVVAGAVGSDLRMEYTAMGDAINLASRMEQTAEPGTVQIAHDTYKLVAPLFEFEDLGAIPIKGKDEPVPTYRVLRRKATPGKLRGFGGASVPLVGHQEPRRKLLATLEQLNHGNGQIGCIIGEVGLGKSRLIRELRQEWDKTMTLPAGEIQDRSPVFARWYETFSLSYETTRPYGLFQNFLRQVLGATQADPPVTLLAKVDSFLGTTVPLDRREGIGAVLKTLFGLAEQEDAGPEGEAFKSQLFETITDLVSLWIGDRPGVMVCDDVHWSDPASIDLLTHLFKLSDRLPILILCVLRPDRSAPGWELTSIADRDYSHHYTEIRLEALSRQDSYTLLKKLLMVDELSESLREGILAKAAGNPLFIEEVVRGLIDNGSFVPGPDGKGWRLAPSSEVTSIDIPDSLHSLLMARIDRLAEAERHTLQLAAVIGRSFTYRVLHFILQTIDNQAGPVSVALDKQLDKLKRLDLIIQVTRIPELGFMFRQALVQEVTYKTILRKKRREYHRLVGEAIESLFPGQVDEQANFLAHHFSRAEDHARALKYHTLAGDSAYRLFANAEAEKQYALALDVNNSSIYFHDGEEPWSWMPALTRRPISTKLWSSGLWI
jgi:class 3 adenylate cyclase